jgi:hypothetical protein
MRGIMIALVFGILILSLTSCSEETILIKKDICREPGNYCHEFIIAGGEANISFPSVNGSDFNYTVEGV